MDAFAKLVLQVDKKKVETQDVKNLTKVSVKEKLKMLRKELPELLELTKDLRVKLSEVKSELEPFGSWYLVTK